MAFWKIVTLACTASVFVDAKSFQQKRAIPADICDPYNNTNKIQCYCKKDNREPPSVKNAECYLADATVNIDDNAWSTFKSLSNVPRLTFTNTRGISLTYVPTEALKETKALLKLEIKYGNLRTIGTFAFANHSVIEEITLRDNQIITLDPYSFIHHKDLKIIGLDTNNIVEINRNVFVDLPALEMLYLTNNQISTIHDRAFIHLGNLKELEIDRNKVFSLNNAVFEGLKNLEKLDLSSNSLEVIGDNTFQALENLKTLNLEGNKIQMLDDRAFNGLGKLLSLSLARNKLTEIGNDKVFEGLGSILSLSLKGNQIKELKNTLMSPILSNFYGNSSYLDVEGNNFPCDCRLDWFISLMNKTLNKHLKITIENLKCIPDANLKESWAKTVEMENNTQAIEEETQAQGADYEYYDESQLNGILFYVDVRNLLNCDKSSINKPENKAPTKETTNLTTNTIRSTTAHDEAENGLESVQNNTTTNKNEISKGIKNKREKNDQDTQGSFTTTRLATVSAKPESKIYENMASDEAKPDKIKAQKNIQVESKTSGILEEEPKANNGNNNLGCVLLLSITVLSCRL